jgi:hypothetical protein
MGHVNKGTGRMESIDSLPFIYIALDHGLKKGQPKDVEKLGGTKVGTRSCK